MGLSLTCDDAEASLDNRIQEWYVAVVSVSLFLPGVTLLLTGNCPVDVLN